MRQHAKHVNTYKNALFAVLCTCFLQVPLTAEQQKEVFYLCDPSPLALYDACDHPTTSGGDHIDTVIYKRGDLTEQRTQVKFGSFLLNRRCLKTTEKVFFNIASEASYVYILSGQKLVKNANNSQFWRVFENLKLAVKHCYQTGHLKQDKHWWKMPKFENATF